MRKLIVLALVISFVLIQTSEVQAYKNGRYGFSIDPPSAWTVDDTISYAAVVFCGPTELGFRTNINVQVESTGLSLEGYIAAGRQQLQILPGYSLISEGSRQVNGISAYEFVFTIVSSGITVQEKEVVLITGGKAFVMAYGSSPLAYQNHLAEFESSIQTFMVTGSEGLKFLGLDWWLWLAISIVIAVAIVGAALAMRRTRRTSLSAEQQVPPSQSV
ncbi:MAG: PsbP-related protein [Candidatus Bathyarchaeia archaeon]